MLIFERINKKARQVDNITHGKMKWACCAIKFLNIKSVAYNSQGIHTGQLEFCNWFLLMDENIIVCEILKPIVLCRKKFWNVLQFVYK